MATTALISKLTKLGLLVGSGVFGVGIATGGRQQPATERNTRHDSGRNTQSMSWDYMLGIKEWKKLKKIEFKKDSEGVKLVMFGDDICSFSGGERRDFKRVLGVGSIRKKFWKRDSTKNDYCFELDF